MEIKEAVEVLKGVLNQIATIGETTAHIISISEKEALQTILSFFSKIQDAEGMPKKKELHSSFIEGRTLQETGNLNWNDCHDDFLAWYLKEVDEWNTCHDAFTLYISQLQQEWRERWGVANIIDIIVDFMRINKDPEKGFIGYLKEVGLKDINGLAHAIAQAGKEIVK